MLVGRCSTVPGAGGSAVCSNLMALQSVSDTAKIRRLFLFLICFERLTQRAHAIDTDADHDASALHLAHCNDAAQAERRLGSVFRSTRLDLRLPRELKILFVYGYGFWVSACKRAAPRTSEKAIWRDIGDQCLRRLPPSDGSPSAGPPPPVNTVRRSPMLCFHALKHKHTCVTSVFVVSPFGVVAHHPFLGSSGARGGGGIGGLIWLISQHDARALPSRPACQSVPDAPPGQTKKGSPEPLGSVLVLVLTSSAAPGVRAKKKISLWLSTRPYIG